MGSGPDPIRGSTGPTEGQTLIPLGRGRRQHAIVNLMLNYSVTQCSRSRPELVKGQQVQPHGIVMVVRAWPVRPRGSTSHIAGDMSGGHHARFCRIRSTSTFELLCGGYRFAGRPATPRHGLERSSACTRLARLIADEFSGRSA